MNAEGKGRRKKRQKRQKEEEAEGRREGISNIEQGVMNAEGKE
jgi:hypothetical protein